AHGRPRRPRPRRRRCPPTRATRRPPRRARPRRARRSQCPACPTLWSPTGHVAVGRGRCAELTASRTLSRTVVRARPGGLSQPEQARDEPLKQRTWTASASPRGETIEGTHSNERPTRKVTRRASSASYV